MPARRATSGPSAPGNCQDERGPFLLLHFNGRHWRLVQNRARFGAPVQVVPDGRRGLWIPAVAGFPGETRMVHYTGGRLRAAPMPVGAGRLSILGISAAPGSTAAFAAGATFKRNNPGTDQAAAVFEFKR